MNTEKIEKLKKSLSNSKIPADLKPKIEAEIKRLEDLDAKNSPEPKEDEKPVAKTRKPRATKSVAKKTSTAKPSQSSKPKRTAMSVAKEIRKDGESWKDAMARASKVMKEKSKTATKDVETELQKLTKLVRGKKELKGQVGKTNLLIDAKRKAKPMGRRVSKDGNVYYENRANRTDKGTYGKYHLAKGGSVDNSIIDELWRGYASAILFTETDMDSGEPLDSEFSIYDFNKESEVNSKKMLSQYYSKYKNAIEESELDLETVGMDIWYTQSGQGAGFFDHSLDQEVEDKLTKGAEEFGKFPSTETYRGKVIIRGGKSYADGGGIPNNYEGKTPEEVWNSLSVKQREHFLLDHYYVEQDEFFQQQTKWLESEDKKMIDYYSNKTWNKLSAEIKKAFTSHVKLGQYAKGGGIRRKNGQTYDYGRVWTKDHNEFDKGSDHEVNYRRKRFELGGNVVTDLAGHTGGSLGTGDPSMLDGFSNTAYTGLVGETGAMSSGEMFMAGGTLPDGASQSYMITESLGNPAQHFATGGKINEKTNKMTKQKLKDGDNVLVIGRRWFDRANGNTYHTAEVEVNGKFVGKSPMTYGYDEQYLQTAKEILLEQYDFPTGMTERSPMWQLRDYGVTLTKTVTDGLKRDLAKGGGFSEHNGRKYDIGRNWTKDHNEFDKEADHEVEYRRKKSFFADGGDFMTDPTFGNFQNQVFADGGGVEYTPNTIQDRLEYLRGEIRNESISYEEIAELQSMKEYIDPNDVELLEFAGVPEFEDDDNYAKGGKVSPFKNMMETNTITEKEINLIKLRLNNDKVDEDTQEAIDYIWEEMPQLTPDQNKKGIEYLRNLWKSPTGKERANNPFGYREQEALETFEGFALRGFYDAGNRYRKFYVPLYVVFGEDTSFEYAFYNGEVNILG